MKRFLFLLGVCLLTQLHAVKFNVTTNDIVARLNFLSVVDGAMAHSRTFKDTIENSEHYNETLQALGNRLNTLQTGANLNWRNLPEGRFASSYVWDLLMIQAAYSKDLNDFKSRTIGLLPVAEQEELISLLEACIPFYQKIVLQNDASNLTHHVAFFNQYKPIMERYFSQLKPFYRSGYNDSATFEIVLYPMPGKMGSSTATPHGNVLIVGVFEDYATDTGLVGVAIHELAHSLFAAQNSVIQNNIDRWFIQSSNEYAGLAYNFFDEAMATVTGNGWFMEQLTGKLPAQNWYANEEINGFAKAIYPLTKQYLEGHKMMDSLFVAQAIKIFGKTFPTSIYKYSSLFNNLSLIIDREGAGDEEQYTRAIRKQFKISGYWLYTPLSSEDAQLELKNGKRTLFIISNFNQHKNLKQFGTLFKMPVLDSTVAHYYSFIDGQGRAVVYIHALTIDETLAAIEALAQQEFINPAKKAYRL